MSRQGDTIDGYDFVRTRNSILACLTTSCAHISAYSPQHVTHHETSESP